MHVPREVRDRIALGQKDLMYYCDPSTRDLFNFKKNVKVVIDTHVSRMVVDLNRPPYALPPRHPDGVIKLHTIDGRPVYQRDRFPDITLIHQLLMSNYFPYHAELDRLLEAHRIEIAFDCHSMLPRGPPLQKDAGKERPLICIGNNGDRHGKQRKGSLATCPAAWMICLADSFREEFCLDREVTINNPFTGGFITNAHYWHKGVPWVQLEVNRSLYEFNARTDSNIERGNGKPTEQLKEKIWNALKTFWDVKS